MPLYDLTVAITPAIPVFPGDPPFAMSPIKTLGAGCCFNLRHMHMTNHIGTHIDFPSHVIQGGKTSSDYPIEALQGPGLIAELPQDAPCVTWEFVETLPIQENDFVFFKTSNSTFWEHNTLSENFVYIDPEAANLLVTKKVKIVGIDYLSVDKYEAGHLPVHHILLSNDILIVEGLDLHEVPAGRGEITIMPLKVADMDGLPARVTMRCE